MDGMLILASASPRRAQLLRAAGIPFEVVTADVDETPRPAEAADAYVRRLAAAKAELVAVAHPGRLVLGADTTVVVSGRILGKAVDADEARAMLTALAGRAHDVHTGVALTGPGGTEIRLATTRVTIAAMTSEDITAYLATDEWLDNGSTRLVRPRPHLHRCRVCRGRVGRGRAAAQ
jgi:septum formation protein